MRQKVRDALSVGLCKGHGRCHRIYTNVLTPDGSIAGRLPDPEASQRNGRLVLRSREESLAILHAEQDRLTTKALSLLPQAVRIEVQSRALAMVSEDVLRSALLKENK
ncbi:MAG: hypothetical protein HY369_04300 [Candidatus Aenigmarchaeota archaeon]|nr:hypothetical protein [Candidatus Aenigmarchaeota archaeon]